MAYTVTIARSGNVKAPVQPPLAVEIAERFEALRIAQDRVLSAINRAEYAACEVRDPRGFLIATYTSTTFDA